MSATLESTIPFSLTVLDPDGGASLRALEQAAEAARRANTQLREAVAAARAGGNSWARIGDVLGLSRQAAHQRFSASERLIVAWANVERWATRIALSNEWPDHAVETLKRLRAADRISMFDYECAALLLDVRRRSVQGEVVSPGEVVNALDVAAIVSGTLAAIAMGRG